MKAFVYLRVSSLGQVSGDGFERQRESVERFAAGRGFEVEREFVEEISGTTEGFDRPVWNELMACIRANGVRAILIERADRLARDLIAGELMLRECRKLSVKVFETEGGSELTVESKEPTQVLVRQILGAVAEFDRVCTVQKLRAARLRMRARGERCEGGKPFGFRDGEKEVVARVLALRQEDKTIAEIAEVLNAEGLKPRKEGAKWHPTSVGRILRRAAPVALVPSIS